MRKLLLLSLLAFAVAVTSAQAAGKTWKVSGAADFTKGKMEKLSLSSTGELSLAPGVQKIPGLQANFVWDLVAAEDGTLYAGTGTPTGVFRIKDGKAELLHQPSDKQVTCVQPLPDGSVLAATAPRGTVYRIGKNGQVNILAEFKDPYVWDMTLDSRGNVLCATGPSGKLILLRPNGNTRTVFHSKEKNLTSVAVDKENNVYVGTSGEGYLYRITPEGKSSILFDPEESEIRCILPGPNGVLYIGTAQSKPAPGGSSGPPSGPPGQPPSQQAPPQGRHPAHNSIYRVTPGEGATRLTRVPNALVITLAMDSQGRLLAGTGEEGRLIAVDDNGGQTMVTQFEATEISAMTTDAKKNVYLGTSNGGGLWMMTSGLSKQGTFTSDVFNAKYLSNWGRAWWEGNTPPETSVKLSVRTGNSSKPGPDWTDWSKPVAKSEGAPLKVQPGQFAQLRLQVETKSADVSPTLWELNVSYAQVNRRPQIADIKFSSGNSSSSQQQRRRPGSKSQEAEMQMMWKAADPNDDDLAFDLYYKGVDEKMWKELEKNITDKPQFKWDTDRVPDGHYLVKLVASDRRGRSREDSLSAEKVSHPLLVDNSSPTVVGLNATRQKDGSYLIKGTVEDSYSSIKKIEVSHNADEWKPVFASDGLLDSSVEEFSFTTDELSKGEHVFVFAAEDQKSNIGSEKIAIEVK